MRTTKGNNNQPPILIYIDPDICPHCHFANQPNFIFQYFDIFQSKNISIWQCNANNCKKTFIAIHDEINDNLTFSRFLNGLPKGPVWPNPIKNLKDGKTINTENLESSKFIKTYLQSIEAETMGFDEIAGMGFRKAIEYLVKDWAIHNNTDRKEEILEMWLGNVISNFFDGDLKDILERATWLGNDQSHYNKLFKEFNTTHLKELIDLILVELDREFKKRHYIESIEKRK